MPRDRVSALGDCASTATCVTIDSRSDPTSSRCQISRARDEPRGLPTGAEVVLCGRSVSPAGGARRDRTDDLLLAKQALSQLSYGPSREQGSEVSNQRASAFFPECWLLYTWRGHSSVGRAPALQAGGRRFDSVWLHQPSFGSSAENVFRLRHEAAKPDAQA